MTQAVGRGCGITAGSVIVSIAAMPLVRVSLDADKSVCSLRSHAPHAVLSAARLLSGLATIRGSCDEYQKAEIAAYQRFGGPLLLASVLQAASTPHNKKKQSAARDACRHELRAFVRFTRFPAARC